MIPVGLSIYSETGVAQFTFQFQQKDIPSLQSGGTEKKLKSLLESDYEGFDFGWTFIPSGFVVSVPIPPEISMDWAWQWGNKVAEDIVNDWNSLK